MDIFLISSGVMGQNLGWWCHHLIQQEWINSMSHFLNSKLQGIVKLMVNVFSWAEVRIGIGIFICIYDVKSHHPLFETSLSSWHVCLVFILLVLLQEMITFSSEHCPDIPSIYGLFYLFSFLDMNFYLLVIYHFNFYTNIKKLNRKSWRLT